MTADQSRANPASGKPGTKMFFVLHRAMRADARRLAAVLAALPPGDAGQAARLGAWHEQYRTAIHIHQTTEDEVIFPAVAGQAPRELAQHGLAASIIIAALCVLAATAVASGRLSRVAVIIADAVRAAMTAAGLRPERITPAMTLRPPPPARPGSGAPAACSPPHHKPH